MFAAVEIILRRTERDVGYAQTLRVVHNRKIAHLFGTQGLLEPRIQYVRQEIAQRESESRDRAA